MLKTLSSRFSRPFVDMVVWLNEVYGEEGVRVNLGSKLRHLGVCLTAYLLAT